MKVRQNLYIDREISDALEALASKPGGNKSRLVNEALACHATKDVDELFKLRLDRISSDIRLARRDIDVLLESLAPFVRYQLLVTALLLEADKAAPAVGMDRFEKSVGQVGRQLATGRKTFTVPDPWEPAS